MEPVNSSINLVTLVLIGIGIVVVLSLFTLGYYFFGGSSPLERNALGRIEAAQKPEDVLKAQQRFSNRRLFFAIMLAFGFYLFLHQAASEQTDQATTSFFEALTIAVSQLLAGMKAVASEVRNWL